CSAGSAPSSTRCRVAYAAKSIQAGYGTPLITTGDRCWPLCLDDARILPFWRSKRCESPLASCAIFHRRLGGLRTVCGGREAHNWEGKYAEDREQAQQLAHADQALGTPDDRFCQDRTHARFGEWALYQSL